MDIIAEYNSGRRDFCGASLREADLREADLHGADLHGADLRGADLCVADLCGADLHGADLCGADLYGANLRGADLRWANLSQTVGLISPSDWMCSNFQRDDLGVLAYKRIGETQYAAPDDWKIEPGSVISETCNPCRTCDCGCGINFGTRDWCNSYYENVALWLCRIRWEWTPGIVVPYNTDGKARCERLELVERVEEGK